MAEPRRAGVHRRTLYALRDAGQVESLARGHYRLADAPALENPDLVTVAAKVPHGVIYLISALMFHEMSCFGSDDGSVQSQNPDGEEPGEFAESFVGSEFGETE